MTPRPASEVAALRTLLSGVDAVVCDMDGVLYRGTVPIDGAAEAVVALRARGVAVLFATNNATATVGTYVQRLSDFGIEARADEIVTSAVVTAEEVVARGWSDRTFFVIGGAGIRAALEEVGAEVMGVDGGRAAQVVVVSGDPECTYAALREAAFAVRRGASFVATNDDPTFPAPDGLWPGAGALLAAVEVASGRSAEVMGKPNSPTMRAIGRRLRDRKRVAIVGDQAATDLAGGRAMGWTTVLVLSGVTGESSVLDLDPPPDIVLPSVAELAQLI